VSAHGSPLGVEITIRARVSLNGSQPFRWLKGTKAKGLVYGLERRGKAAAAGYALIVEGESDVQTAAHHGVPAFGTPGVAMFDDELTSPCLEGIGTLYVVQEPGSAGEKFVQAFRDSCLADRVRVLTPGEHKDVSALHLAVDADHGAFLAEITRARGLSEVAPPRGTESAPTTELEPINGLSKPKSSSDGRSDSRPTRADSAPKIARPDLALEKDILAAFRRAIERLGLAGELTAACLIYLALVSRLLPWGKPGERPCSVISKGTSGSGKSYLTNKVLQFFPEQAYLNFGSMSKRYLLYCEEDLRHRIIVIPEWTLITNDEELVAVVRTLLSEGCVVHGTVDTEGKRREARRIEKDGPTGLLITTTAAVIDTELETRCLSFVTNDSPEQTRLIFETIARLENEGEAPSFLQDWRELQHWLASMGESRVVIPYVGMLATLMPNSATRLRRDFVTLLSLIRAHATLHRETRQVDEDGRIVATIDDYDAVRELVGSVLGEGVEATVSPAVRETVEAVAGLLEEPGCAYVSGKTVADRLKVGKGAAYDRVRRTLVAGYLVNIAARDQRGQKLVLGTPLPDDPEFLPSAQAVSRTRVGPESDTPPDSVLGSTIRVCECESGSRTDSAAPGEEEAPEPQASKYLDPFADVPDDRPSKHDPGGNGEVNLEWLRNAPMDEIRARYAGAEEEPPA
jgi:hypothetical protein